MGQKTGVGRTTLYRWWETFCKSQGLTLPPKQALDLHKQHFFDWLEAQQHEAEAEHERQVTAAHEARKARAVQGLIRDLQEAIEAFGYEAIYTEVACVVFADELAPFGDEEN